MWTVDLILQSPNLHTIVALLRREKDCGIENSALWERNSATATGTDGVSLCGQSKMGEISSFDRDVKKPLASQSRIQVSGYVISLNKSIFGNIV